MKSSTVFCFVALLIACAVSQEAGDQYSVEEQDVIDPLDMAVDVDYRIEEDERYLQNFRNVCCSECSRYSGSTRLRCFSSCQRTCFPQNQCVNAGRGVYAAWCQSRCNTSSSFAVQQRLITPRQCTAACRTQVQNLCPNRCNDLFPGCNASVATCRTQAGGNCFVG